MSERDPVVYAQAKALLEAELKSDGVIVEKSFVKPVSDQMIDRGWITVAQMIFPDEQTWAFFLEKTGLQRKVRS